MLTIFNRREVYTSYSLEKQNQARERLDEAGIPYVVTVINTSASSIMGDVRSRVGSLGENRELSNEYIIYVHKKNQEFAEHLLKNTGRTARGFYVGQAKMPDRN